MENVITELTTTLSSENIWAVFGKVVPLIGVVTLVALGFALVKKAVRAIRNRKSPM